MNGFARLTAPLLALMLFTGLHARAAEPVYSSQELRQDLDAMMKFIHGTHPDIEHSVDRLALDRAVQEAQERLAQPMTQTQAWRELSKLNPLFADGHVLVTFPDWRSSTRQYLQQGGALFPFEVHVDDAGDVFIRSKLGGSDTPLSGKRIETINGVAAPDIARQLSLHVHGDSPAFRTHLLARRWWFFFWKVLGASSSYALRIDGEERDFPGSNAAPAMIADEASFERQFRFELLPDGAAVLTVASFAVEDKPRFFEFTRQSFERMRQAGVQKLIIDVRENGGGDDDVWMAGILPYIANKPYRTGSTYRLRIVAGRAAPGEKVGDIRNGKQTNWTEPQLANPLRFGGAVYVLIGEGTYSSAILFSNVMQDFGFGRLAGMGDAARSAQSGGVQSHRLPNTGLIVYAPRFVLVRPSGVNDWLQPDIAIPDNPMSSRAAIDALLRMEDGRATHR